MSQEIHCDKCDWPMLGILDRRARMRCIGCGGNALNYDAEAVLAARERNRKRGYIISRPPEDDVPEAA